MTQMPQIKVSRPAATLSLVAALAAVGGMALSAGSAPIRLLGVSSQGNAVLIESTEPAAYVVKRPDPLTVMVELRNVSVSDASNLVARRDPITAVALEQASAIDGKSIARVRVSLSRPSEYTVRSARNTIRLELTAPPRAPSLTELPASLAAGSVPQTAVPNAPVLESPAASVLERVRASHQAGVTTVTLSGNGRLTPADVSETQDRPRRLVLDFPNVSSKAPAQTSVEGPLVKRVRVGVNSREPLVTRVVMELSDNTRYHVERTAADGRDLAVVFESDQASGTVMLSTATAAKAAEPEPDIPLQQAIANAASITPQEAPADPMTVLEARAPIANTKAPAPVRQPPPPPQTPTMPPMPTPQPAPPPVEQPQSLNQQQTGEKKYTGHTITFDFSGADLRAVLRQFADISGLNIIIDPAVPATPVDLQLKDVPWDQVFETLLRSYKLGYVAEGTIIRIAPVGILAEEEADRRKLSEAKALSGDLRVQTFSLSYAKAAEMQPLLVKSALSARGQIQVDQRTNTVIITDLPDRLQTASALIGALDRPEPQVEVEARVVQTTREFAQAVGIQWGLNGRMTPALGNTTNLAFPNSVVVNGRQDPTGTVIGLPAQPQGTAGVNSAIGLALGSVNGAFNLDVALTALERSGKGRVLSTPRLTTQNNVPAEVAQGVQIPIQTVANNTVTVSFKDAVLTLKVTPQITSANTVIMQITLENATPDFSRSVNGIPPINTQRANTQVQVNDGATTIIGGIFVSQEQTSQDRTPLLHRVPLLGWLFKRDAASDTSTELLIFITPRILR